MSISEDKVKKFIEYAVNNKEFRYSNMVKLTYSQGLRIHEVSSLDMYNERIS
ncbi:hypothetical protein KQI77_05820 [Clostridium sp. MSJ-8]|uniref:hypothetical protein n=1 Tax=Clostridium sp. MSJ-8 TaxID=2841510 RepID=UPI001C0F1609|nr:hypothetical protein [Clostridium sp. MSJ-8]MBU5487683.1 hypothetical protein [Clostridium sp. MSJ-8]